MPSSRNHDRAAYSGFGLGFSARSIISNSLVSKPLRLPALAVLISLFLGSCATRRAAPPAQPSVTDTPATVLPAEITMNPDAGRGNWLFVTLRLESGEELPFFLDTGSSGTVFDKSLEPELGKRLHTFKVKHYSDLIPAGVYAAPKLFLGDTPLVTGPTIWTFDVKSLSSLAGRPVMGILGMDCLRHYRVQMDFAAGKLRFLPADGMDKSALGVAYPLSLRHDVTWIDGRSFLGTTNTHLMVDAGNAHDGDLATDLFHHELQAHTLRVESEQIDGKPPGKALLHQCTWDGRAYTNLLVGHGVNSLGLRFLARHLVTFDFPNRTLYLKPITSDPLRDEQLEAAADFLRHLQQAGLVPGWTSNDTVNLELERIPKSQAYDFRHDDGLSASHYRISRIKDADWKLEKAWKTDQNDHTTEEFPIR